MWDHQKTNYAQVSDFGHCVWKDQTFDMMLKFITLNDDISKFFPSLDIRRDISSRGKFCHFQV